MTGQKPHVLVTGAASGIGRATAWKAVQRGWQVTVVDRDEERLSDEFGAAAAHRITADLSVPAAFDDIVAEAEGAHRRAPTALVHCAARYVIRPALELTVEEWRSVLDVNVTATLFLAAAVARRLIDTATPGALVTLSSTAARLGDADEPAVAYSSSKAAVEAITRQLAIELGAHGIRVNSVAPGLIDTPMLRIIDHPEQARDYVAQAVPLRRLGTPADVADVCLFLVGPESGYVSGTTVTVDGALTA